MGGVENIKEEEEKGEESQRRILSPPYHNTTDKWQPPRIKPNSSHL